METERTINFTSNQPGLNIRDLLLYVKTSLEEKGYNYTNQISGYLITGDPSYIPRYNNSRNLIKSIERDLIIEELLRSYLEDDE
ncbi:MAG: IreB family regulatory phosphoprotein [Mycoplasmatales bacterium]